MPQEIDSLGVGQRKTVSGAMLGVAVLAVFQILTLPTMDRRLTLALYCFAVSIPLLTLFFRAQLAEDASAYRDPVWYVPLSSILGTTIWFVGLASVFFHFSIKLGLVFSALSLLGLRASGRYQARLKKLNNP